MPLGDSTEGLLLLFLHVSCLAKEPGGKQDIKTLTKAAVAATQANGHACEDIGGKKLRKALRLHLEGDRSRKIKLDGKTASYSKLLT